MFLKISEFFFLYYCTYQSQLFWHVFKQNIANAGRKTNAYIALKKNHIRGLRALLGDGWNFPYSDVVISLQRFTVSNLQKANTASNSSRAFPSLSPLSEVGFQLVRMHFELHAKVKHKSIDTLRHSCLGLSPRSSLL